MAGGEVETAATNAAELLLGQNLDGVMQVGVDRQDVLRTDLDAFPMAARSAHLGQEANAADRGFGHHDVTSKWGARTPNQIRAPGATNRIAGAGFEPATFRV